MAENSDRQDSDAKRVQQLEGECSRLSQLVAQLTQERDRLGQELEKVRAKYEECRQVFLAWAEEKWPLAEQIRDAEEAWERYQRGERGVSLDEVIAELEKSQGP